MAVDMDQQQEILEQEQIVDQVADDEHDDSRFADADEFQEVATELINTIGQHRHYAEARIRYLWRRWGWNRKGRPVIGSAHVLSEEQRFLTGYDLKFVVNHEMWEAATPAQREAMADHLLCMIYRADDDKDGNPVWRRADYDCIEFNAVVRRHGLWQEDLQRFMDAHQRGEVERAQGKLFDGEEPQYAPASADQSAGESATEAPDDNVRDGRWGQPSFDLVSYDYEETGMPLYRCEANLDMTQLAEAAYQAELRPCAIELVRSIERGGATIKSPTLYHYRGPGHDPVIQRITGPMMSRWLDQQRRMRGA